jgi:hypothetical protein
MSNSRSDSSGASASSQNIRDISSYSGVMPYQGDAAHPIIDLPQDITEEFKEWVQENMNTVSASQSHIRQDREQAFKIKSALDFIETENIAIIYKKKINISTIVRETSLIKDFNTDHSEEKGHFYIEQLKNNSDVLSTSIYLEDDMLNNQLARLMIGSLCFIFIREKKIRPDTLIFIDSDASAGFWESIGMIDNPLDRADRRSNVHTADRIKKSEGEGMEKSISFNNLCLWALGIPGGYSNSEASLSTIMAGGKNITKNRYNMMNKRKSRKGRKRSNKRKSRKSRKRSNKK